MSGQRQSGGFSMDGYVDVAQRLREFRAAYPSGSLQPWDKAKPYAIETIGDDTYLVVVAAAYRTPEDERPGVGMAYEPYPGKTPYTRGSELQNAETSAWGRAILAALTSEARRIASADEVRNRRAEQGEHSQPAEPPQTDPRSILRAQIANAGRDTNGWSASDTASDFASWSMGEVIAEADEPTLQKYLDHLLATAVPA